ncbi:D-2-hydroxyacid dehydrogenase [Marinobacterium rhizophilum]|uniref:D-2-hydroxyacid dehydrogenase n=1 Tax=Marinobacterium rhizophilum TaxID=420402 RepID=A0ABY5HJ71_9GAMM|nr:D-2-hydroxyacid dehydrogenase [Marinobacterium rhizophilum]UTW11999.1 D-2-hydroxyacid dehydrogenase [Marinobacterium rhizophilum]
MSIKITFLDRSTIAPHVQTRKPLFDHEWVEFQSTAPDEVVQRLRGSDIAVVNKVTLDQEILAQLPQLKLIAVAATGYDKIDIDYCRGKGISVSNIRNYAVNTVPEHALSLIMVLRRNLFSYCQDVKNGEWKKSGQFCFFNHPIGDLAGSRLGIIGKGVLGQAMATIGRALGMDVVFAARKGLNDVGFGFLPFEEVLATSDVVSLHCPLTPATRNLIALPELQLMKETALLINTARGGLVNEADLETAIVDKMIAGAGFDVIMEEPPADNHPLIALMRYPNFILTPHIAWASTEAIQALSDQLIDNIENFVAGKPSNLVYKKSRKPSPSRAGI